MIESLWFIFLSLNLLILIFIHSFSSHLFVAVYTLDLDIFTFVSLFRRQLNWHGCSHLADFSTSLNSLTFLHLVAFESF